MIGKIARQLLLVAAALVFIGTSQAEAQKTGSPGHADFLGDVISKGLNNLWNPDKLSKWIDARIEGVEGTAEHAQREIKSWFKSGYEHFSSAAVAEAVGNVTGINRKRTYETYRAGYAAASGDWTEVVRRIGSVAGSKLKSVAQGALVKAASADLGFDPVQTKNLDEIIKGQQAFRRMLVRHAGTEQSPLYNPYLEGLESSGAETHASSSTWSNDKPWRYRSELDKATQSDNRMSGGDDEYARLKNRLRDEGRQAFSALEGKWSGTYQDRIVSNGVPVTADGTLTVAFDAGRQPWHADDVVGTASFSFMAYMVSPAGYSWPDGNRKRWRLDNGLVMGKELKWSPSGRMFYSNDGMAFFPDEESGSLRMFRSTDDTGRTFESDLSRGELDDGVFEEIIDRVNREIARGEYTAKLLARKRAASRQRLLRTLQNMTTAAEGMAAIMRGVRGGYSGSGSSSGGRGGGGRSARGQQGNGCDFPDGFSANDCQMNCRILRSQHCTNITPRIVKEAQQSIKDWNCDCIGSGSRNPSVQKGECGVWCTVLNDPGQKAARTGAYIEAQRKARQLNCSCQ